MPLLFSNDLCSAYLVEVVRAFEANHRAHYLGRTALQKLTYFSQALGVPIPCSFEIYNFGPYSDAITFNVESMLADDILKDVSLSQKYSNYRLKSQNPEFEASISKAVLPHRKTIEKVVKVLGRFEPAQLEVLATLHFIAKKIQSLGGQPSKPEVVSQFFKIKGNKFPPDEVSSWYDSLKTANLI